MTKLIYNHKTIANKMVYCNTFFKKGLGLMFRGKSAVENTAWIFNFKKPRSIGITMFMVFFPIDILFLDKNNKIINIVENLKPFSGYHSKIKIYSFIELKQGTIKKYSIKVGQKIIIK